MDEEDGALLAPDGTELDATYELIPGAACVSGATRSVEGRIDVEYDGSTTVK